MLKVAILGYGTVGSGVAEVIYENAETIANNAGMPIDVKYIVDIRDFKDDKYQDKLIKDFSIVENDPEILAVVETIGGIKPAFDFTKRSLLAGKSVITSNKELVACHGAELLKIARENNVNYLFEASVGGGIPIIRPISQCLVANRISQICGILNGTTNYILTRMIKGGLTFEKALAEAQEKGYAERDPSADVQGSDACRKICILSALAFGHHVYPNSVTTEGIDKITLSDVGYAASGDAVIKLLGRAVKREDGKIYAFVGPHFVSNDTLLANVEDVYNAICVTGNAIGNVMFYGAGAGKYPTASAVVADIIDAAKHLKSRKYINWDDGDGSEIASLEDFNTRVYVRLGGESTRSVAINIFGAVEFLGEEKTDECAFITKSARYGDILEKIENAGSSCRVLSHMMVLK